ncbi:MAG: hypothetical protein ACR2QA_05905 [Solirubrobacteraceae bacterium]
MPDPWIAIEERALAIVAEVAKRQPLDRAELERALQVFAIAKNRDLEQTMPNMSVFDDDKLVPMVEALVQGNRLGG